MARATLEVADIFHQHGAAFRATHPLSPEQRRVMRAMVPTATMLGRVAGPCAAVVTAPEGTADAVATSVIIPTFIPECASDPQFSSGY